MIQKPQTEREFTGWGAKLINIGLTKAKMMEVTEISDQARLHDMFRSDIHTFDAFRPSQRDLGRKPALMACHVQTPNLGPTIPKVVINKRQDHVCPGAMDVRCGCGVNHRRGPVLEFKLIEPRVVLLQLTFDLSDRRCRWNLSQNLTCHL